VYIRLGGGEEQWKVPKVKHSTASVLKVGWNANHERTFGSLDRMMDHVDKSRIWIGAVTIGSF